MKTFAQPIDEKHFKSPVRMISLNTAVIGSGAAGLNAADRLYEFGQEDIAIFTEGLKKGTSRNTGSDKQTYYKMSTSGAINDSPYSMAEALFRGGCMDGDLALAESAMSLECFYRLCMIGVPFPCNKYGEYVGYQTDHDTLPRGTSAGPLTSNIMFRKLLQSVQQKGIPVYEHIQVVKLLTSKDKVTGFIGLDNAKKGSLMDRLVLVNCTNIILATGAPAGMYLDSVYPPSQTGSTGIALEAGAAGKNLTEWQYGIASISFRWNLSGSYQQVLPRYLSTDMDGNNEKDFLAEYFKEPESLLNAIFLKGYQWPFTPGRLQNNGSSIIDYLIFRETAIRKRRVFLDYTRNPEQLIRNGIIDWSLAGDTAYSYLKNSRALLETPAERLIRMNRPAYDLYLSHKIDLRKELLEINVCAQHNNGGLSGDIWWESNLRHLFPVGEVNGSHGVLRPGGAALNSGQVGSTRAAWYISRNYTSPPDDPELFLQEQTDSINAFMEICEKLIKNTGKSNSVLQRKLMQERMTRYAGHIRNMEGLNYALELSWKQYRSFETDSVLSDARELGYVLKTRELLFSQIVYLTAMQDYVKAGGKSRGSYLITTENGDHSFCDSKYYLDDGERDGYIQEVVCSGNDIDCTFRPVRPIPPCDNWFENVWSDFRSVMQK